MLAIFRNPLLRLQAQLWWLMIMIPAAVWGVRGLAGLRVALTGVGAYLAFTVGMISIAWTHGGIAWCLNRMRQKLQHLRFLCPHCLRFSPFYYACGKCGKEIEGFTVRTSGIYTDACPHCRKPLDCRKDEVKAHCRKCSKQSRRNIYHNRRLRFVGVFHFDDLMTLNRVSLQQEQVASATPFIVHDDGQTFTYILNLSSDALIKSSHLLPEVEAIWLDHAIVDDINLISLVDSVERNQPKAQKCSWIIATPQQVFHAAVTNNLQSRGYCIEYGIDAAHFIV